jgi:RimJ/RimL family protein N-acetyltransferase
MGFEDPDKAHLALRGVTETQAMMGRAKTVLKKIARILLGDYAPYQIYSQAKLECGVAELQTTDPFWVGPVDAPAIAHSPDPLIRDQIAYAGPESMAFACFHQDRIIALCFYWFGERYRSRNFWPLATGEAKLVQIVTLPEMRGQGVATMLIMGSCHAMLQKGLRRVYARVWHSNLPSRRAFERAGWQRVAFVLEINPFRRRRPIRVKFHSSRSGSKPSRQGSREQ